MRAISVRFNEEEFQQLEEIVAWYSDRVGISLSKTSVIKALLYGGYKAAQSEAVPA